MSHAATLKNILANYGSKLWGFASIYLFIPLYIDFLGVEAYAIISFYSLILGLISFADAGLSSAITREFAKDTQASDKYSLLAIVERYYLLICVLIFGVIFSFSSTIASHWLNSQKIANSDISYYVKLIGLGAVMQLISSLYFGALMGLQVQVRANVMQVSWSILRTVGIITIFYFYQASLELFLIWQIVCNLVYVIVLRYSVIKYLKSFSVNLIRTITKLPSEIKVYISGMVVVAIISAINTQADKLVTSSLFSLSEFGYYSLASTLAQVPLLLASPLAIAVFPILSRLASIKDTQAQETSFRNFTYLLNIMVIPIGIIIFIYAREIVVLWTGKRMFVEDILQKIVYIVRLLTIGGVFLALQLLPFYYLLSNGQTRYTVKQGLVQLVFGVPALYLFVKYFGIIGAGIPWLLINFFSYVYLYYVLFSSYLKENAFLFFFTTLLVPLLITFGVTIFFYLIFEQFPLNYKLASPVLIGIFSVILNIAYQNYKRHNKLHDISWLLQY
ncbi:oligosaccharide flippase family protein [Pedobacter kyonggii]|uniref:Polysaccharide biosynthesis protein n=1 Tax=Pedobacter kyonggii TaxID=1926871 RepID=A0A4Q9HES5_9SPHI|nr:oligosaccharide flippase family protein [Pedobacter kyonggii]TBO43306.1 hypothetical protein EYS08_08160 [Pedobacter kyonggii]